MLIYFYLIDADGQAKKDLSSHCDQIVMSLATLNKQRSADKQPQSIKTTVTISKVSKTSIGSTTPILSQSRKIAPDGVSNNSEHSVTSSDSPQTVREASKSSSDDIPYADDSIARKKEIMKEKFLNDSAEAQRRGEFETRNIV